MKPFVLAIDSGSTATKVAVFGVDGALVARESASTPRVEPSPGRVERDPEEHWRAVAGAVRKTVAASGVDPREIATIGLAAQGDGVQLIGTDGRSVGPAILSSDTRAAPVIERWSADGTLDELRRQTGQVPFPGSPAPLLRALCDEDPRCLHGARWLLSSKDWLRFRMTGQVATDRTDAAASFADAATQDYSAAALVATGLEEIADLLPPILEPSDVAGTLTPEAADLLGLVPGTPVATGLHDVAAAVVGSVGLEPGRLCIIVGTFGVNVVLAAQPHRSPLVNTRSGPTAGLWTVRRTSRASIANVEWAARAIARDGGPEDRDARTRVAISSALAEQPGQDPPIYIPFLFGGNAGQPDAAAFLGLRSWHQPPALLRAVVEGVTFNHRLDVELVVSEIPVSDILLAGGAARSPAWRQLFADVLGRPVMVAPDDDAGTRGAAICAAVAGGAFPDLRTAAHVLAPHTEYADPGPATAMLDHRYRLFRAASATITDFDALRARAAMALEGA